MNSNPHNSPRHPHGVIEAYTDVMGRTQTAVTGPTGHVLVTTATDTAPYVVWHSDALRALVRTSDVSRALAVACQAAGFPL